MGARWVSRRREFDEAMVRMGGESLRVATALGNGRAGLGLVVVGSELLGALLWVSFKTLSAVVGCNLCPAYRRLTSDVEIASQCFARCRASIIRSELLHSLDKSCSGAQLQSSLWNSSKPRLTPVFPLPLGTTWSAPEVKAANV